MNVSTQAIKRYEKRGCGGASARLLQLLSEQPIKGRPGRKPKGSTSAVNHRPYYKPIKPGDWGAVRGYEVVEPKLDGHYGELSTGPQGWVLRSRGGHIRDSGGGNLPRAHLLVEDLGLDTTDWARFEAPQDLSDTLVAWAALDQRGNYLPRKTLHTLVSELSDAGLPVLASYQYHISEAPQVWASYVKDQGYEGLVFRSRDGSRFAKMKPRVSWDYVCVEVDHGSAIGGVYTQNGALVKDATRCRIPKGVEIAPGDVFEVTGLKLSDRGTMRSPKFDRLRPDKPASECLTPIAANKLLSK